MWVLKGTPFLLALAGVLVFTLVVLLLLHNTPNQVKRYVIVALTFLGGLFYVLEFFVPPHPVTEETRIFGWNLTTTAQTMGNATQVIAAFTFLLGVYNLVRIHGNAIRRKREGWPHSLAFFVAFTLMVGSAFWR